MVVQGRVCHGVRTWLGRWMYRVVGTVHLAGLQEREEKAPSHDTQAMTPGQDPDLALA